ncbi:Os05g0462800 [Oryza sativa Japonica Group]|uniref:Uncharacterized protein n=2 Tax=Oryza sativa subsp. japonica TaxID=39947 RepID=A0A0N7KKX4_ORYSJ|nr:hypothetical protein [Oryza sativa Japonica Group]AAU90171.1 hypothetical protein [Oryza sativa Japonica Group]BAS94425.1 Os05g0462800 [Oryza sativa Japonica Group]
MEGSFAMSAATAAVVATEEGAAETASASVSPSWPRRTPMLRSSILMRQRVAVCIWRRRRLQRGSSEEGRRRGRERAMAGWRAAAEEASAAAGVPQIRPPAAPPPRPSHAVGRAGMAVDGSTRGRAQLGGRG